MVQVQVKKTANSQWCSAGECCRVTFLEVQNMLVEPLGSLAGDLAVPLIWPNPSDGQGFSIDLSWTEDGSARVELFDALGRLSYATNVTSTESVGELAFRAKLPPGAYLVRASANGTIRHERLVID
jgi:hypothetical protein